MVGIWGAVRPIAKPILQLVPGKIAGGAASATPNLPDIPFFGPLQAVDVTAVRGPLGILPTLLASSSVIASHLQRVLVLCNTANAKGAMSRASVLDAEISETGEWLDPNRPKRDCPFADCGTLLSHILPLLAGNSKHMITVKPDAAIRKKKVKQPSR